MQAIYITDDVMRPEDESGNIILPSYSDLYLNVNGTTFDWYSHCYIRYNTNSSTVGGVVYFNNTLGAPSGWPDGLILRCVAQISIDNFNTYTQSISRNIDGYYHGIRDMPIYKRKSPTFYDSYIYFTGLYHYADQEINLSATDKYLKIRMKIQRKSGSSWVDCSRSGSSVWKVYETYAPFYQSITPPTHFYGNSVNQFTAPISAHHICEISNTNIVRSTDYPYATNGTATSYLYWCPCIKESTPNRATSYNFKSTIYVTDPSDSEFRIKVAERTVSGTIEYLATDDTSMFGNASYSFEDVGERNTYEEYGVLLRNVVSEYILTVQLQARYGAKSTIYYTGLYYSSEIKWETLSFIDSEQKAIKVLPIPDNGDKARLGVSVYDGYGNVLIDRSPYTIIPIIDYSVPSLANMSIHRCDVSGEPNDMGEYCKIEWAVAIEPINNQNSKKLTIQHPAGTTSYNPLDSYTQSEILIVAASSARSYDIVFTIEDDINTIIRNTKLSTAGVIMDWLYDGKGVAFGKVSEVKNAVEISETWSLICEKLKLAGVDFNTLLAQILTRIDGLEDFANNSGTQTQHQVTYYNANQLLKRQWVKHGYDALAPTDESPPKVPSRESTPTQTFSFVGWNTDPDKDIVDPQNDPNASKDIEANRSIYAMFSAATRYYTVFYYKESELLKTQSSIQYKGSATPPTNPTKTGYTFAGWLPSGAIIEGTINAYAQFYEDTEIEDSWEDIMAAVDDGTAIAKYKPGNYKELSCGEYGSCVMRIKGYKIDHMANSGKKAFVTWEGADCLNRKEPMNPEMQATGTHDVTKSEWTFTNDSTHWIYQFKSNLLSNDNAYYAELTARVVCNGTGKFKIQYKAVNNITDTDRALEIIINGQSVATITNIHYATTDSYEITCSSGSTYDIVLRFYSHRYNIAYSNILIYLNWASVVNGATITYTMSSKKQTFPNGFVEKKGSIGGWKDSALRTLLNNDLYNQIEPVVRNHIKAVGKISQSITPNADIDDKCDYVANEETQDKVWIPSREELKGNNEHETDGVDFKTENAYITKKIHGTNTRAQYWLRSANKSSHRWSTTGNGYAQNDTMAPSRFCYVNYDQYSPYAPVISNDESQNTHYVCIGFCT